MRNIEYLDNNMPGDSGIGELQYDESNRQFRIINGVKVIQIEEKTQRDIDMNLIINRMRLQAGDGSPSQGGGFGGSDVIL